MTFWEGFAVGVTFALSAVVLAVIAASFPGPKSGEGGAS